MARKIKFKLRTKPIDKRLAYAIPNAFTASSLICALVALNAITVGNITQACWLITISLILDGFDGRMARILNATSKLGAQADSLADFVAFGVVPGFLAWQITLKNFGIIGFFVFILYVLCGGFRLARFNILNTSHASKSDFMGLPIPAAAAAISSFVLFNSILVTSHNIDNLLLIIMPLMSFLMVSTIPYLAVNKKHRKKRYLGLLFIGLPILIILAIRFTVWVYLIAAWTYIGYGLFNLLKISIYKFNERQIYKKTRKALNNDKS